MKLCLLAGAIALAFSNPQEASTPATYVAHPYVKQVFCEEGRGTAFQVKPGVYLSVNHVTRMTGCKVDGKRLVTVFADPEADFSINLLDDRTQGGIAISCAGYNQGQAYWSLGYAGGLPVIRAVMIRADGFRTQLWGGGRFIAFSGAETVIPGMSGGPVLDGAGRVVGVVNAYNAYTVTSFSRPLKDTAVCQG